MSKNIVIDGIDCIATRDPNGVSYAIGYTF